MNPATITDLERPLRRAKIALCIASAASGLVGASRGLHRVEIWNSVNIYESDIRIDFTEAQRREIQRITRLLGESAAATTLYVELQDTIQEAEAAFLGGREGDTMNALNKVIQSLATLPVDVVTRLVNVWNGTTVFEENTNAAIETDELYRLIDVFEAIQAVAQYCISLPKLEMDTAWMLHSYLHTLVQQQNGVRTEDIPQVEYIGEKFLDVPPLLEKAGLAQQFLTEAENALRRAVRAFGAGNRQQFEASKQAIYNAKNAILNLLNGNDRNHFETWLTPNPAPAPAPTNTGRLTRSALARSNSQQSNT